MNIEELFIRSKLFVLTRYPFLGHILLSMKFIDIDNDETTHDVFGQKVEKMSCDGVNFYWSPKQIDTELLTLKQNESKEEAIDSIGSAISHCLMHVVLMHVTQWKSYGNNEDFHKATDLMVNSFIKNSFNFNVIHGFFDSKYDDLEKWTTEAIYDDLIITKSKKNNSYNNGKNQQQSGSNQYGKVGREDESQFDSSENGKLKSYSNKGNVPDQHSQASKQQGIQDKTQLENKLKQIIIEAAISQRQRGTLPLGLEKLFENISEPKVDYKSLLQIYIKQVCKDDYNWKRRNRRHQNIWLPSLYSRTIELVFAVDTSDSMGKDLKKIFSETIHLANDLSSYKIHYIECDTTIQKYKVFGKFDGPPQIGSYKGFGGTAFEPVFNYVKRENIRPDILLYFTDLCGTFPNSAPNYPVLWISTNRNYEKVPFGKIISIDPKTNEVHNA